MESSIRCATRLALENDGQEGEGIRDLLVATLPYFLPWCLMDATTKQQPRHNLLPIPWPGAHTPLEFKLEPYLVLIVIANTSIG